MKYNLTELIEALEKVRNAPVHPDSMQLGQGAVFLAAKDKDGKILYIRQEVEITDFGAYVQLSIKV
jgi:hypothetical protein